MNKTQQFWRRIHEVTNFCLTHRGRCFPGWPDETVFFYVAFHGLCGTIFVVKSDGKIKAVGFGWPAGQSEVAADFNWRLPKPGKCLVIMEVIGERRVCGNIFARAVARWPQVGRFFAWRHGRLVEFSRKALERFCLKGAVT